MWYPRRCIPDTPRTRRAQISRSSTQNANVKINLLQGPVVGDARLSSLLLERGGGADGALEEDVALPAIDVVDDGLANKLVLADAGQDLGPDGPVDATSEEDGETSNAVDPVGKVLVLVLVGGRGRDEGSNDEVDVAEQEEDDDGERSAEGRVPVPSGAVEVKVNETAGDEDVDDGKRVRDEAIRG